MELFFILLILLFSLGIVYFIFFRKRHKGKVYESESLQIDTSLYDKYIVKSISSRLDFNLELMDFQKAHEITGNQIGMESNFVVDKFEVIKLSGTTSFYAYHNFVSWMNNYDNVSLGFAKCRRDFKEDYLFFSDSHMQEGDTQIGSFRNGKCFFVFLPDLLSGDKVELTSDFQVSFKEVYDDYHLGNIENASL